MALRGHPDAGAIPGLRLILPHCGGALPTLGRRIAEHTVMGRGYYDAGIGPEHVAAALRGLHYDTTPTGSAAHPLLPALQVTDSEHVLFGSDGPAAPEATPERTTGNRGLRGIQRRTTCGRRPRPRSTALPSIHLSARARGRPYTRR
ncbi:amidohydrolase family protein [Streptomyces sp. NBC_00111]|uniref:amidohydrolase family protein n=1 Tax=Streptomyces sp. NBC_00111 TaxID=2975655 RepID=UPI00386AD190